MPFVTLFPIVLRLGMAVAALIWALFGAVALAEPITPVAQPAPNDRATLDGCQVIARIDGNVVLACEVLWMVNHLMEANRDRIPPEQEDEIRAQLMRREIASALDRKLLYNEFRRSIPPENMPHIEQNLLEPFEEREVPILLNHLKLSSRHELDHELVRLGSSVADARRTFNEKAIAGEWLRSKVKISESVSPDEMLEYYQANLSKYEFPTQARWEELMVRKARFRDPRAAYAAIAELGNEVWQRAASQGAQGPLFAEVAKVRSDGYTAQDGGLHDWTTKGALKAKAIDDALFSLEVGQMSPILETEAAFHIVRVLERKEAGRRPFTEVQAEIRERLRDQRFEVAVDEYLESLRKEARIWTIFTGPVSADVLMGRAPDDTQQR